MSLLDDVSIVVTPNGYKAGELYAVVPVPTEGAEEVDDGDFLLTGTQAQNTTGTYWTTGTGWTISGGTANCDGSQSGNTDLIQNITTGTGKQYKITYTVSNYSAGSIFIRLNSGNVTSTKSSNGTFTEVLSGAAGTQFILRANLDFTGSISNVSVKEYTAADMDVTRATAATRVDEAGLVNYAEIIGGEEVNCGNFECAVPLDYWTMDSEWGVLNNKANYDALGQAKKLYQSLSTDVDKSYIVSFDISNVQASKLAYFNIVGSGTGSPLLAGYTTYSEGSYEVSYTAASAGTLLQFTALNSGSGGYFSITNISVKEIQRDNVPRIDYSGGGCPHILAEPQRTNLIPYSEDFSQWSTINSTILTGNTTSPDGTVNADRITSTSTGDSAFVRNTQSTQTVSTVYSYSCFVKKGTTDFVRLANRSLGNVSEASCWFDIQNGVVGDVGSNVSSTEIESFGDGWYKCTVIGTTGGTISTQLTDIAAATSNGNTSATTGDYIYYWGAQLEEGSYATSYIPNFGTAAGVTRNQDIFTRDGIGSLINSEEGTLFVEMARNSNDGAVGGIQINGGNNVNSLKIFFNQADTISVITRVGGSNNVVKTAQTIASSTAMNKFALVWKLNDYKLYYNGDELWSVTSASVYPIGTLNNLEFKNQDIPFEGKVKQLQVYKTALTDEQLLQLTGESGTDFYESYAEMASALTYTIQ
jgi:hypothetical protein